MRISKLVTMLNNSRFLKAQRPSGSFTKYFYFPLNDIGMARKSAHRFGIRDFYNFKALNAFAARYFCLNRRIQEGGLTRCAPYSLSNLSWLTAFSSFFPQKVCFCFCFDGIYKIGTRPTIFKMRFRKDTI